MIITIRTLGDRVTQRACACIDAWETWVSQIGRVLTDGSTRGGDQENTANAKSVKTFMIHTGCARDLDLHRQKN